MVLITQDADNENWVNVGADIEHAQSLDHFKGEYNNADYDDMIVEFAEGYFGDCWLKLTNKPDLDADGYTMIDGVKCKVQNPGTHPGGNFYWLTPVETVWVPVFEDKHNENEFV